MPPLVSVVVPTKNEAKNIDRCLLSIKQQSYSADSIELIVVDNHSSDATAAIARRYTPLVFTCGPERSAQRNFGMMKQAHGQYVMYIDADMILSPGVIAECVAYSENDPGLQGLYISEIILGESFWCHVRRFERSFYDGTAIDAIRFLRRSVFLAVGGFDLTMTGPEDWDLDKKVRQRGRVALIRTPLFHNEADFSLRTYVNKKKYYADSFAAYISRWGKDDPDIRKQFGIRYRFCAVFTEQGKWCRFMAHPVLASGLFFLKALTAAVCMKKYFNV